MMAKYIDHYNDALIVTISETGKLELETILVRAGDAKHYPLYFHLPEAEAILADLTEKVELMRAKAKDEKELIAPEYNLSITWTKPPELQAELDSLKQMILDLEGAHAQKLYELEADISAIKLVTISLAQHIASL